MLIYAFGKWRTAYIYRVFDDGFPPKSSAKSRYLLWLITQQCQSWKHSCGLLSPMMQLHFWTSSFQNIQYCMKPWVRREGFRWKADFISLSIPFKMKATCSSSVWAPRFGRWPLKVSFQTQPISEILKLVRMTKTAPWYKCQGMLPAKL